MQGDRRSKGRKPEVAVTVTFIHLGGKPRAAIRHTSATETCDKASRPQL